MQLFCPITYWLYILLLGLAGKILHSLLLVGHLGIWSFTSLVILSGRTDNNRKRGDGGEGRRVRGSNPALIVT